MVETSFFDFELPLDENCEQLLKIEPFIQMLQSIRSHWADVKCIRVRAFTEGITNRLVSFDYMSNSGDNDGHNDTDRLLVRIYGQNTEKFIDRQAEIKNLAHLHRCGLCSPVFAQFRNGLCYGFTPGQTIDNHMLTTNNELTEAIAVQMARMHVIATSCDQDATKQRTASLSNMINKYLSLLEDDSLNTIRAIKNSSIFDSLPDKRTLQIEVDQLCNHLNECQLPIVFCHNDLLMKNIIYDSISKSVSFIDFEYGDYNYQAFDIANHFCEYQGMDPIRIDLIPDFEYQRIWLNKYLSAFKKFSNETAGRRNKEMMVTESEILQLYRQVCKCQLASNLMWGIWALVQAQYSTIDFGFAYYGTFRVQQYLKKKTEFLTL